jgi:two-component system cell cycle sensor histidine kinase/response regulator CckA
VIEARDGAEALLQAEIHGEPIDMVITDVVMPNMDGPALVRELLQSHPRTKVLLTSGCPLEEKDVQDLIATGAQYIQKPFSRRELMARVESILASLGLRS